MKARAHVLLALTALVLTATAHADILVVRPVGPGFTDIQSAVNAAQDGDLILVKPSTDPEFSYPAFTINDKSVSVVGSPADDLPVRVDHAHIDGLSAGRKVLLSRLEVQPSVGITIQNGVTIEDALGSVRIQDSIIRGAEWYSEWWRGAVWVCDSIDVAIVRCELIPTDGEDASEFIGGKFVCVNSVGEGGAGIRASSSTVLVSDSIVHGSDGGTACVKDLINPDPGGNAASGVLAHDSTVYVFGCFVDGGLGGWGGSGGSGYGDDASPLYADGGSSLIVRDCVLQPPSHLVPPIHGNAVFHPDLMGRFTPEPDPLEPGETTTFHFQSPEPGQLVYLWVGLGSGLAPLSQHQGVFTVLPPYVGGTGLFLGVIESSGLLVVPIGVPALPGIQHVVLPAQAVFVDADGALLGPHTDLIYIDE